MIETKDLIIEEVCNDIKLDKLAKEGYIKEPVKG